MSWFGTVEKKMDGNDNMGREPHQSKPSNSQQADYYQSDTHIWMHKEIQDHSSVA